MPRKILILRSVDKSHDLAKFLRRQNYQIFQLATHKIIQLPLGDSEKPSFSAILSLSKFASRHADPLHLPSRKLWLPKNSEGKSGFKEAPHQRENLDLSIFDGIILTSANAAGSLANFQLNKKIKIFAVGKKTAEVARFLGFENCEFPKQENALSLAILIKSYFQKEFSCKDFQSKKLLYLRGSKISFDLQQALESATISIAELVVYQQSQNRNFSSQLAAILTKTTIDEVLVFSQNSLNSLSKLIKRPCFSKLFSRLQLVCFSNKIAEKAKKNGFRNTRTFAQKPFLKKFYELNSPSSLSL